MKKHASDQLNTSDDPRCILVSRLRIWSTAKAFFKRSSFVRKKGLLHVTFATFAEEEDAVDLGGPRREFLHLLTGQYEMKALHLLVGIMTTYKFTHRQPRPGSTVIIMVHIIRQCCQVWAACGSPSSLHCNEVKVPC